MRKAVLIAAVLAVLVPLGAQAFAAPTVTTAVPANSTKPVVSGVAQQGQTLTTTNGTWTNSPTSYKHRWRQCDTTGASCTTISGATTRTYVVAAADVGHTLKSNVEACNASGCSGWVASAHTAVVTAASAPQPVGQPAGTWTKLTFDDEFSGTSLNTTSWTTSWFGGASQNNVKTDPANVSLDGQGHLVLKLSSSTDGASVTTNPDDSGTAGHFGHGFQFGNGTYVEGRVWLPGSGTTVNDWPAFWTDGQNWPVDGETDIVEGLGTATSNYHSACAGTTKDCPNNSNTIPGTWAGGWHTYGFDREAGQNKVYWDGNLIRSYSTSDGGAQQYIIANIGSGEGPTVAGDQLKLDYVRVWQH